MEENNYKELTEKFNILVSENIKKLFKKRNIFQDQFCKEMQKEKISIPRTYFNQILNKPSKKNMPAFVLLAVCDFLGITVENLVSEQFNPDEYVNKDKPIHEEYLKIVKKAGVRRACEEIEDEEKEKLSDPIEEKCIGTFEKGEAFILNPNNTLFAGYLQNYYCYYYPTHSSENKQGNNIIRGILSLNACGDYCKACLKIDTNTLDENNNINYKKYEGYAAISTTVKSIHCIMCSENLGEYCFLMFRHFKLNFSKQDCRIAEVLSSSSVGEDRQPTVLRMLLSKEMLKEEDLDLVSSALLLNYSTISITKKELLKLRKVFNEYESVIDCLLKSKKPDEIFFLKENDIYNLSLQELNTKEKVAEFIMLLRKFSVSYRYNKVSGKADDMVREILISKGYYKKKINNG